MKSSSLSSASEALAIERKAIALAGRLAKRNLLSASMESPEPFFAASAADLDDTLAHYASLVRDVDATRYAGREIEWLLDNFYVVEAAIADVRESLRNAKMRKIRTLSSKTTGPIPHVYEIVSDFLRLTDHVANTRLLTVFLVRYQRDYPLSIRELDATPLMLKLALILGVRELIVRSRQQVKEFAQAERLLKEIETVTKAAKGPVSHARVVQMLTARYKTPPPEVGVYLVEQLSQYGSSMRPIIRWLKLHLLRQGVSIKKLQEVDYEQRDRRIRTASNIVESLRWISQIRWNEFVEKVNPVDLILARDPAGRYALMDSRSKSEYHKRIVALSDGSGVDGTEIARLAVKLAALRASAGGSGTTRGCECHVGYYLMDDGKEELEEKIHYRPIALERLYRYVVAHPFRFYATVSALAIAFITVVLLSVIHFGSAPLLAKIFLFLSVVFLGVDIGLTAVTTFLTGALPVRRPFGLDIVARDLAPEQTTCVVVPAIVHSKTSLDALFSRFESNFVGNRSSGIFFALLVDLSDAPAEIMPEDAPLIAEIKARTALLNEKYPAAIPVFHALFRKRLWNPRGGVFMGWERKRGKLREFNQLIRGSDATTFVTDGPLPFPRVTYVITLDEDTELPREAALKLIGCIDHPLNRPVLSADARVERGYGIIQPHSAVRMATAERTRFSRLFSSAAGQDAYSDSAADVYQDLFGEGIFYGKGIYHVDTVEATMDDRIPDNTVLSHDLLEGIYARTAFASHIRVFEEFPARYGSFSLRHRRWIRGDWQILPWLFGRERTLFSAIDRWKIADNARRSLQPLSILALVMLTGLFAPSALPAASIAVLLSFSFGPLAGALAAVITRARFGIATAVVARSAREVMNAAGQTTIRALLVAYEAFAAAAEISVTLGRMLVTRRNLLEWNTAHVVSERHKGTVVEYLVLMWFGELWAVIAAALFFFLSRGGVPAYGWSAAWLIAPFVMVFMGTTPRARRLRRSDERYLRLVAYRSLRYFTDFVTEKNKYLVPDHFQADIPYSGFAPGTTTSVTNLGMMLVSFLSGYRLGFLCQRDLLKRLENSLSALSAFERFNGHFYNWYHIHHQQAVSPAYVSSVDSANFILSLITLAEALENLGKRPLVEGNVKDAFVAMLTAIAEDIANAARETVPKDVTPRLRQIRAVAEEALSDAAEGSCETPVQYERLLKAMERADGRLSELAEQIRAESEHPKIVYLYMSVRSLSVFLTARRSELEELLSFHVLALSRASDAGSGDSLKGRSRAECGIISFASRMPSLVELGNGDVSKMLAALDIDEDTKDGARLSLPERASLRTWHANLSERAAAVAASARARLRDANELKRLVLEFVAAADFSFLYNKERGLFHLGYNATMNKIDNSYYDFLASESNAVSFVAMLEGNARTRQWFHLGRPVVHHPILGTVLASWGGSLFEYLTPLLFFSIPEKSLLNVAARRAVLSHVSFGKKLRIPWGMGESAFAVRHTNGDYQYQIFGDPGLGLKRGLGERIVVAPYTTALSLGYVRGAAVNNLRRLAKSGAWGAYGFYDAVDYTAARERFRRRGVPVKIYYAHHLGFTIAAITNALEDNALKEWFRRDPRVRATSSVFDEPYPITMPMPHRREPVTFPNRAAPALKRAQAKAEYLPIRSDSHRYVFLSNGTYSVALNNSGGGWSLYKDMLVTNRTLDPLDGRCGTFIYLNDVHTGALWSATYAPTLTKGMRAKAVFSDEKAEFHQHYNGIASVLSVSVAREESLEVRTLSLTNTGGSPRTLAVSSFAEPALARPDEFLQHPAFRKLFIKSEFREDLETVMLSKRPAQTGERELYGFHSVIAHYRDRSRASSTLSREDFLDRHGSLAAPYGLISGVPPRERPAFTLDPIFSLSKQVLLAPGETVALSFLTGVAPSESEAESIITRYRKRRGRFHIELSTWHAARTMDVLAPIGVTPYHIGMFQRLLSGVVSYEFSKPPPESLFTGTPHMRMLWKYGISGDLPLVVVRVSNAGDMPFARLALLFYRYCRYKNVMLDIVILNEYPSGYVKTFEDDISLLIRQLSAPDGGPERGSVFHLKTVLMQGNDAITIIALARLFLDSNRGAFEKQVKELTARAPRRMPDKLPVVPQRAATEHRARARRDLVCSNGLGGFDPRTGEYVMHLSKQVQTPTPWVNIVGNENFGTIVSESGGAFTYSGDSFDNRLTAWHCDPLVERSGEAFYLRDEKTGDVWSPTPLPSPVGDYTVRHGIGYSVFESHAFGIDVSLTVFVPRSGSLKVCRLELRNRSGHPRSLSLTAFVEPVLGISREGSREHVAVERDDKTGVFLARNRFRHHFFDRVVFADAGPNVAFTSDRTEFLGPHNSLRMPAALKRSSLSGSAGSSADACIALQRSVDLQPDSAEQLVFTLGEAPDAASARAAALHYRSVQNADAAFQEVKRFWARYSDTLVFRTPEPSIDMLANRWLLYQAVSSRLFAKSGFYQPSGAFGFRDQLQDAGALVWSDPARLREHILVAARHQFREGDALNWWHPHNDFGLRSTVADHHLWLVWAVNRYVSVTGDGSLLDERAEFVESPVVVGDVIKRWTGVPNRTAETATIYEHCIRAVEKSLRFGSHGLPLMGGGDWNDGLNHVGDEGKGESVWLGWFLFDILSGFIPFVEARGESEKIERYRQAVEDLREALEKRGWDGGWYARAFLDSGAPLGSSKNREFKISSVAQSWAALSGAASDERVVAALASVKRELMSDGDVVRLLAPPVSESGIDVGYLAAYPPGVRENGAQYNHAALWMAQAFARVRDEAGLEEVLRCANPVLRSANKEQSLRYRVEPYAVASDIYAAPSYQGRGGWTWYTGSAGLFFRTLMEYVYGIRQKGNELTFDPVLPRSWNSCELVYRYKGARYYISIRRGASAEKTAEETTGRSAARAVSVIFDGTKLSGATVALPSDKREHRIEVTC